MKLALIILLAAVVTIALWLSIEDSQREHNMLLLELQDKAKRAADTRRVEQAYGYAPARTLATPTPVIREPKQPFVVIRPLPTPKPTPSQADALREIQRKYGAQR